MAIDASSSDVEVACILAAASGERAVTGVVATTKPPLPFDDNDDNAVLPTDVCHASQLERLPQECRSNENPARPLRHVDEHGQVSHYALNPMQYSVGLILLVELLERFSFYGIYYTQTLYLTGAYNEEWNAGYTSVEAASLVSVSTAVAYTTPFIGALLADSFLGDYQAILCGSLAFYLPGVLLIALSTIPHLLGEQFNQSALIWGLTILWPLGTGMVKSVVNVFGAKQHHPILQSSLIERYYVNFYVAINTGALVGITLIPILAQRNVTIAYMGPLGVLAFGILLFVMGSSRYVISKPPHTLPGSSSSSSPSSSPSRGWCCGRTLTRSPPKSPSSPATSNGDRRRIGLFTIFRISLLIVPFCIAYSQMPTTFIVQGSVMRKAWGFVDAATMNSVDAASVLVFGYLTAHHLYPALAIRNIKIPTTYKFAIGSTLAALAIVWALVVEHWIHASYDLHRSQISVLWQSPSYVLIGWGEIFAVSAAYEAAFSASPSETKALASAINIFCIGGIPNVICLFLFRACQHWFVNRHGNANLSHLQDYATARVGNYFCVLLVILLVGVWLNVHPSVRKFVESVEEQANECTKTPLLPRHPQQQPRFGADEASPLLRSSLRHEEYLAYGRGPVLNRMGSMRAGSALGRGDPKAPARKPIIKYKYIPRLYKTNHTASSTTTTSPRPRVLIGPDGRPLRGMTVYKDETNAMKRLQHHEST